MAIGTKDVQTGGGGTPKLLQPGNTTAIIHSLELDQPQFMVKDDGYFLLMHMEGPDLGEDFEGFLVDKDSPEQGRHKGQVGKVKANRWAYKDGTTKSGIAVSRDNDILKFIKNLCEAFDIGDWFEKADNKYDTIEAFIDGFNADKPFAEKVLNYCLCSRTYEKDNGYTGHDLFLPKYSKDGIPFEAVSDNPEDKSRLLQFDETKHVEASKPKEVTNFGDENTGDPAPAEAPAAGPGDPSPEFDL